MLQRLNLQNARHSDVITDTHTAIAILSMSKTERIPTR